MVDVVKHLGEYQTNVTIFDPLANPAEVMHEYQLETIQTLPPQKFDAIVLTVAHNEFLKIDLDNLKSEGTVVYDVKGILGTRATGKL